ncbi:MAG: cephalosporin hydroxylase [Acidobacteria bacterium]|nr:cephalosporin hydroxylase [Acidobacteriota bacterium]
MPQGDALKEAARRLAAEFQAKMEGPQGGVGTFADHALLGFIAQLEQLDPAASWEDSVAQLSSRLEGLRLALQRLQLLLHRRAQGRFVDYQERTQTAPAGLYGPCDIGYFDMVMSQGAFDCLRWKGMPLFKTVYDFALYPMILWALKPRTVIELGSGTGASALWLADLTALFGFSSHVYSVDLQQPAVRHEHVSFIQGDCRTIDTVFADALLREAAHPWMLIEDAHVNVYGVLRHFHAYLERGDYVIVEDSASKQDDIRQFLTQEPGGYKVDTYYTDFFGRNATCAQDSILMRA